MRLGEYPFVFDEMDGSGAEYESFGGVWCLAASAYWALLTGDHSDLDGMLLSERHYHDRYVAHMECYGAPLDTSKAVDSEGILGYIKRSDAYTPLPETLCILTGCERRSPMNAVSVFAGIRPLAYRL